MTKIGLYSGDRTLFPLLSSALGKQYQITLQSDEDGMNDLVASGGCDVMILDLNPNCDCLEHQIESFHRWSASTVTVPVVVMGDDAFRSTAFELVRRGAFGYCSRPPSIRELKTMLSRACENSSLKEQLKSVNADLQNIGGRPGGSITAAWFIREFADGTPWIHLDIAGTVAQNRETQLAADPGQHHAPGDAHHLTGGHIRWQIAVPCAQPSRGRAALKADRIGFGAGLKQPFSLAEADPDLLRHVLVSHTP